VLVSCITSNRRRGDQRGSATDVEPTRGNTHPAGPARARVANLISCQFATPNSRQTSRPDSWEVASVTGSSKRPKATPRHSCHGVAFTAGSDKLCSALHGLLLPWSGRFRAATECVVAPTVGSAGEFIAGVVTRMRSGSLGELRTVKGRRRPRTIGSVTKIRHDPWSWDPVARRRDSAREGSGTRGAPLRRAEAWHHGLLPSVFR
jgi:hypothetical protein